MKKFIVILVLMVAVFIFSAGSSTPYSGKYVYAKDTSVYLYLNSDNTFKISNSLGKFNDTSYGKYHIANNNISIQLTFDNTNVFNDSNKNLEGEIQGSKIVFRNVDSYYIK
jgi:hypothetical protein